MSVILVSILINYDVFYLTLNCYLNKSMVTLLMREKKDKNSLIRLSKSLQL